MNGTPRDARAWFSRFHAGTRPEWTGERVELPRWLADLGPVVSVAYLRATPRGEELREHRFAPHARPTLARDDRGALAVVGGHYNVTEVGIVDNKAMTLHRDPRAGFTSAAPMARYTPRGVPIHGLATPREGAVVPRANPLEFADLRVGAARVLDAAVVGGTAFVGLGVSDMIVERTMWSESARAVAQGLGLGLPGALLCFTPAQNIGTGLVAAGMAGAGLRVARARQWDRTVAGWLARMMPGRTAAREGGSLWDEGADVRVEAVANG